MKRLLLSIIVLLTTLAANAYDVEIDGIYYNIIKSKGVAEVTYGDNYYSGEVVIPSIISYNGDKLDVAYIGEKAFYKCYHLLQVKLPSSILTIGLHAFNGCYSLKSINLPENLTTISTYAFYGCSSLESIVIPNSVDSIGEYAFRDCKSLNSVVISSNVTSISRCFGNCTTLKSVTIPSGVTEMNQSFYGCVNLQKIDIPNTVESIYYAFEGCTSLENISLPNSIKQIGGAFMGCSKLSTITIPDKVESIPDNTFENCTMLSSVQIANSISSIGFAAFRGCTSLGAIVIPNSVTTISKNAFENCSSLERITLPTNLKAIRESTFSGCASLQSIDFPTSLTSIESHAFNGCSSLSSVVIPSKVKSIGDGSFMGCTNLSTMTFPSGTQSVSSYALSNCPNLKSIYCYAEKVPTSYDNTFNGSFIEQSSLHVPASAVSNYKTTAPWSSFGKIVALEGTEPEIKKCATPTISYQNGKLTFNSDTEDATFVSEIKDTDIKTYYTGEVVLSATYTVSVYATATGYENSDVATATLCWLDAEPKTEGTTNDISATRGNAVLVQSRGGVVRVEGVADGTSVAVYSIAGQKMGASTVRNGACQIATSLNRGEMAVIRIGDKAVKVLMQ